jgi:hypothetical protein
VKKFFRRVHKAQKASETLQSFQELFNLPKIMLKKVILQTLFELKFDLEH